MDNTSPPSPSRPARRAFVSASALIALSVTAVSAGSCGNSEADSGDGLVSVGANMNNTPTGSNGAGGPAGSGSTTSGGVGSNGAVTPGGTSSGGATTSGGAVTPGGMSSSGGASTGGVTPGGTSSSGANTGGGGVTPDTGSGGAGSVAEPCVDVEPPPDPEWPDATCAEWATETEECSAAWFSEYCDVSCGRCVPEGGMSMPAEPEPEPCMDVEPPPDPEWPDATCAEWATETEECSADWFSEYCNVSCGRCVPEGGGMSTPAEPEPEPCMDVEPPPDPEWPGVTCAEWATETEECSADWFSEYCDVSCGRCVPEGGLPEQPSAPDCSGEGLPNVTGGEGFATRYWDCCQTHCSQFTGHRCGQDGVSGSGDSRSSCEGGGSFACYDEAPRAVSDCLSYGHVAKSNPDCGQCYRIQFTGQGEHNANDPGSKLIEGKQMIVKVTNTGGDVAGNQFDLMIPGGGVGRFDACSRQWGSDGSPEYLGAQYGGFLTNCAGSHEAKKECVRQECMKIPEGSARDGCIWFVDWLQVADNPRFTSQQTDCPF